MRGWPGESWSAGQKEKTCGESVWYQGPGEKC